MALPTYVAPVRCARYAALITVAVVLLCNLRCHQAFQGPSTSLPSHHLVGDYRFSCSTSVPPPPSGSSLAAALVYNNSCSQVYADVLTSHVDMIDYGNNCMSHRNERHSGMGSSSSREGFLKTVVGVGTGVVAAMSGSPEPAHALLEDVKKTGRCPKYEAVEDFDVDKYMGVWYELAYHDWTQIEFCGCTRFNMTRTGSQIKDAFTTKCPYQYAEGETFMINMREEVNMATPGSFQEHAFYNTWRNKVVALWRSSDGEGGERYERAIQLQCVEILGRRAFVGINFLSRAPIVRPQTLSEMFDQARLLGLATVGGNPAEMVIVPHEGCQYPSSTDSSLKRESLSWGSGWGVNKLALT